MKKDVMIYFTGKMVPAVVNLLIIILAVRFLGEAEYGKFALVFYAVMLTSTLTIGWIQQGILRFLSSAGPEEAVAVNRFYLLTLFSTAVGMIMVTITCLVYFHLSWTRTLVAAAFILLYNIFQFHLTLNQTRLRSFRYALLEGSYNLFYIGLFLVLVLIFGRKGFMVLFVAMTAGLLATESVRVVLMPGARAGIDRHLLSFDREFALKVFGFGFPIMIWLFLALFMSMGDRFIIKEFATYQEVGTYTAVKDFIIKIATFSTVPVLLAFHPAIIGKWNAGEKRAAMKLIRKGLIYCLLIAVIIIAGFLLLHPFFYHQVLHISPVRPLLVSASLVLSAFLWQAAMLLHKPLELLLKPNMMLAAILVALVVNLGANLVFVPRIGYPAAAVIALVSVAVYIAVVVVIVFRFHRQGLFK